MALSYDQTRLLEALIEKLCGQSVKLDMRVTHNILAALARGYSLRSVSDFMKYLAASFSHNVRKEVTSTLIARHSDFLGDDAFYGALGEQVIPCLNGEMADHNGLPFRIWCAGEGDGREAISVALTLMRQEAFKARQIEIVRTDFSADQIERGDKACYNINEIQPHINAANLLDWFMPVENDWRFKGLANVQIKSFEHNLLDSARHLGAFDLVICRNVLTTMSHEGRAKASRHLAAQLALEGLLMVGPEEQFVDLQPALIRHEYLKSVFRNTAASKAA